RVFSYEPDRNENGERYLTTMVAKLAREHPVFVEYERWWVPIGHPEDLARAEKLLAAREREGAALE
ncbi:MAG: hypothetical protein G01um101472_390, partial [Parcubacteria group bacterium Gr01-1014_72]